MALLESKVCASLATRLLISFVVVAQSKLCDGFLEGVYLRVDEPEPADKSTVTYLEARCKLVRPDFIQNIEDHWMKKKMVRLLGTCGACLTLLPR